MKTTSFSLSKQLREKGYPQEAAKWWWQDNFGLEKNKSRALEDHKPHNPKNGWIYFASPTADEILEKLPNRIQFKNKVKKNPDWSIEFIPDNELEELKHTGFLTICNPGRWCVNYMSNACFGVQNMAKVFYDDNNLANAAAKCWLYLKEKGLLGI